MKLLSKLDFSDDVHVKTTLLSMAFFLITYFALFKILRKTIGHTSEYCCRIVTFIHGIIACCLAITYIVLPSIGNYNVENIPYNLILTHSMGYFTFDLIWCAIHGETPVMMFHHVLTVVGLLYYSFKISKQYYIVYALGLTEITNPLLQLRWALKYHNKRDGLLFRVIEMLFIVMFFSIRLIVLSIYLYQGWFRKELGFTTDDLIFTTLGALTGYALSFQMYGYILHQLKKKSKRQQPLKEQ